MKRRRLAAALAVVSLSFLWWLPFSIEPPGRDQSLFMAQSQALLDGSSLYTQVWEQKPPGILVAYAMVQALAGRSYTSIVLLDWLAGALTALLLTELLWRHTESAPGAMGAAVLCILYQFGAEFDGFWGVAQPEVLIAPLLAFTLLLLTTGSGSRRAAAWRGGIAGLSVAAMIGLKYSALPLVALILPRALDCSIPGRMRIVELGAFVSGLIFPVLLWIAYLHGTGRFGLFWEATVTFNLAHAEVSKLPRWGFLYYKILYLLPRWLPLYLFMGIGAVSTLVNRLRRVPSQSASERLLLWGILTWFLCLASVFWQSKFWNSHYHIVLVPLCLLAGIGIARLGEQLSKTRMRPAGAVGVCVVLLWLSMSSYVQQLHTYAQEHDLWRALRDDIAIPRFLATYRWGLNDYEALDTMQAAQRLRDETHPDDRVFVWGFEPGIYVYSQRRPASRFFYDYPFIPRFAALHESFRKQLMQDLEANMPAYIVVVSRDNNDIETQDSVNQLLQLPWLQAFIVSDYDPAWSQGDFWVMRRKP